MKRWLSMLLVFSVLFTAVPTTVLAEEYVEEVVDVFEEMPIWELPVEEEVAEVFEEDAAPVEEVPVAEMTEEVVARDEQGISRETLNEICSQITAARAAWLAYKAAAAAAASDASTKKLDDFIAIIDMVYDRYGTQIDKSDLDRYITDGLYNSQQQYTQGIGSAAMEYYRSVKNPIVARIGDTTYPTLKDALEAATKDQTVTIMMTGTYGLPFEMTDVKLAAAEGITVTVDYSDRSGDLGHFTNVTFEGITFNFGTEDYTGFRESENITFKKCTLNGKLFSYSDMWFQDCTFNATNSNYIMQCYRGSSLIYQNCRFNGAGKFLKVCNEGTALDLSVIDCTFTSSYNVPDEAPLNVFETYTPIDSGEPIPMKFTIGVTGCKCEGNNFPEPDGTTVINQFIQLSDRVEGVPSRNVITCDNAPLFAIEVNGIGFNSLSDALDKAIALSRGNRAAGIEGIEVTVELLDNIVLTGWSAKDLTGGKMITILGNGNSIKGLTQPLFSGTGSTAGLTFNGVQVIESTIDGVYHTGSGVVNAAAFIGAACTSGEFKFIDCIVKDCVLENAEYMGAFIGYAAGYSSINNGPIFETISFENCKVLDNRMIANGSVGGLMGHATGNTWTAVNVNGVEISLNGITCTKNSPKAGAMFGTIGVAGHADNGRTGGVTVTSATVSKNQVYINNGTVETSRVFGRYGSDNAGITINGGTYDVKTLVPSDCPKGAEFIITGGTFTDPNVFDEVKTKGAQGMAISGGTYKEQIPKTVCAEGYKGSEADENGNYTTEVSHEAKIGTVLYTRFSTAIDNAKSGETVTILEDGTYVLPAQLSDVTVVAAEGVTAVVDYSGNTGDLGTFSGVTFSNINFKFGTADYVGFRHSGKITFNKCTLDGKFFSYGDMVFTNCTFNAPGADYSMWCYGGENLTYTDCIFNGEGKYLNVYNEGLEKPVNVAVTGCTFVNTADTANKAALNVKETCNDHGNIIPLGFNVQIENCKIEGPFPAESSDDTLIVVSPLLQIDSRKPAIESKLSIEVDRKHIYPTYVAKVGNTEYTTLSAALNDAMAATKNGDVTVELLADIALSEWTAKEATHDKMGAAYTLTINGNGHSISGLTQPLFSETGSIKGITFNNVHVTDSTIDGVGCEGAGTTCSAAFIGCAGTSEDFRFNNCSVTGCTLQEAYYTGAFVGYAAGWHENGPVFETVRFTNCRIDNNHLTAKSSVGGLIGHATANIWTEIPVDNVEITNNTIICTDDAHKAGAMVGTVGAAGHVYNNKTGGVSIDNAKVLNNKVYYDTNTPDSSLFGRYGSKGAGIIIYDGIYDVANLIPNDYTTGAEFVINGGTFTNPDVFKLNDPADDKGMTINGGKFKVAVPENLCSPDLRPTTVPDGDGYYGVTAPGTGDIYYDLQDSEAAPAINDYRNPILVVEDNLPVKLQKPSRRGYTFVRWMSDDEPVTEISYLENVDQLIVAEWKPIYYKVTYKNILPGDENDNPANATIEGVVLEAPSRDGAEFGGWFTDAKFTKPVTEIAPGTTKAVTLFAKWDEKVYTIAFNANLEDGAAPAKPMKNMVNCLWGKKYTLTANSYKNEGYAFVGWSTEPDGSGDTYIDKDSIINPCEAGATLNLYAIWAKLGDSYEIHFDNNDGDGSLPSLTATYGTKVTLPRNNKTMYRSGYTFAGWTLYPYGPVDFKDGASVQNICTDLSGAVTLYAAWNPIVYSVKYTLNGGKLVGTNPKTFKIIDDEVELVAPTKVGYTFNGWKNEGTLVETVPYIPATGTALKLVADFTPNTYTLTLDGNGADGNMDDVTCTYNVAMKLPANGYTKTNCIFNGWNTKEDGTGKKYANLASIRNLTAEADGEFTLYAQWICTQYNVVLDPNGAECDGDYTKLPGTNKTSVRLPKTVPYTYADHTFLGWNTREDGKGKTYKSGAGIKVVSPDDTYTLYAMWASNTYDIVLHANDNSGREEVKPGFSMTTASPLPENPFEREGFIFSGWNTRPDGKGKKYGSKAKVKGLCNDTSGSVTLYAQWKPIDYTIKYVLNGGKNPALVTLKKYRMTTDPTLLPTPTKKGCVFGGWYTDKGFNPDTEIIGVPHLPANGAKVLTVYAKWVSA